jgi:hypothetical protein
MAATTGPRGSVRLMITISPQLDRVKAPGPTRSFICAVPALPEVRLTPCACPKVVQVPAVNMPALVRSIPASPNSLVPRVSFTDVPMLDDRAGGPGRCPAE